ncbi:hypothetical protein MLD38_035760 [Melastoma candidum]|uniref:Uncharacterized protein n=1 Tax=Melastoma candidum TaxID=119954 RepID=A0ACB9LHL2_9MYRT|nr:hypothetical protein MLD38_035760 [Melastoma candidum]
MPLQRLQVPQEELRFDCIFAPYFSDQGPTRFAAVHKVFGTSNVSKLLMHLPVADRCEAVAQLMNARAHMLAQDVASSWLNVADISQYS